MNLRSLVLTLLLAGSALALAPAASAGVPEHCPERTYSVTVDTTQTVAVYSDCTADVTLFEGVICAGPWITRHDHNVGPVHAVAYTCGGPTADPLAASSMQPPIYCVREPCPGPYPPPAFSWCKVEGATPASPVDLRTPLWGTDAGCDIDVDTNWHCLYGEVPVDRTVGPAHVSTLVCTPPIDPATSSAAIPPPVVCVTGPCPPYPLPSPAGLYCRAEAATPAGVRTLVWGTDEGCDVDVDTTDYYACAPPSGSVVERTAGPLHVVLLVCDGGIPGALLEAVAEILRQLIAPPN